MAHGHVLLLPDFMVGYFLFAVGVLVLWQAASYAFMTPDPLHPGSKEYFGVVLAAGLALVIVGAWGLAVLTHYATGCV